MRTDRDPELAKDRAYEAEIDRMMSATVADLIEDVGTVRVQIKDIASDRYLSGYVGPAYITVDLQALIEAVAQAEVDK